MALPEPVPGLVIRYSYLWESQARRGQEEGLKDRPCAIVLAVKPTEKDAPRVMVAAITHTPPQNPRDAIEIPPKVGQGLGLDYAKSWIVTREVNIFTWPGPDIRVAGDGRLAFGRLPHNLAEKVRQSVFDKTRDRTQVVNRDVPPPPRATPPKGTPPAPAVPAKKNWDAPAGGKPREIKPLPPRKPSKDKN